MKVESKYNIGDTVFTIYDNKVRFGTIHALTVTRGGCKYQVALHGDPEGILTVLYETHLIASAEGFMREAERAVDISKLLKNK
jgi:hypothetical protein